MFDGRNYDLDDLDDANHTDFSYRDLGDDTAGGDSPQDEPAPKMADQEPSQEPNPEHSVRPQNWLAEQARRAANGASSPSSTPGPSEALLARPNVVTRQLSQQRRSQGIACVVVVFCDGRKVILK